MDGSETKLCSSCLVEVDAIAKEKQLEREARKLEKDAIKRRNNWNVKLIVKRNGWPGIMN